MSAKLDLCVWEGKATEREEEEKRTEGHAESLEYFLNCYETINLVRKIKDLKGQKT